jgi:peptidoglycan hydrolase-like protein with peptidoglycan-binding domain
MKLLRSPHIVLLIALFAAAASAVVPASEAGASDHTCDGRPATWVGSDGADTFTDPDGVDDVIVALGGDDVIDTGAGDDVICAGDGDDTVRAGDGHDSVFGGPGDDVLRGGGNDDVLTGGPGDDVIEGGSGSDRIDGGDGSDELWGSNCVPPSGLPFFCRQASPSGDVVAAGGGEVVPGSRVLHRGSVGADVGVLQEVLAGLGFDPGPADGVFGPLTDTAVRAFQAARGLGVDGLVGAQTRAALSSAGAVAGSPPPSGDAVPPDGDRLLRRGIRGDDVGALQRLLAESGFDPGPIDGVFGSLTAAAVRAFQTARDLVADGVVGPQTQAALAGDSGTGDVLGGGAGFDTCDSPDEGTDCESHRGLRSGGPFSSAAAEEWRPLITEVFTEWGLEGEVDRAVAVAACESSGDPFITTPSTPGGAEVIGLFQHKSIYWPDRAEWAGVPGASPFDPRSNVVVAAWLVDRSLRNGDAEGGWSHFDCGRILGFWSDGA